MSVKVDSVKDAIDKWLEKDVAPAIFLPENIVTIFVLDDYLGYTKPKKVQRKEEPITIEIDRPAQMDDDWSVLKQYLCLRKKNGSLYGLFVRALEEFVGKMRPRLGDKQVYIAAARSKVVSVGVPERCYFSGLVDVVSREPLVELFYGEGDLRIAEICDVVCPLIPGLKNIIVKSADFDMLPIALINYRTFTGNDDCLVFLHLYPINLTGERMERKDWMLCQYVLNLNRFCLELGLFNSVQRYAFSAMIVCHGTDFTSRIPKTARSNVIVDMLLDNIHELSILKRKHLSRLPQWIDRVIVKPIFERVAGSFPALDVVNDPEKRVEYVDEVVKNLLYWMV